MVPTAGAFTPLTIEQRFAQKVGAPDDRGCWNWGGKTNDSGYAIFTINHKAVRAHRLAWEWHHKKPIPAGQIVRHMCDNRSCVNPDHLVAGTFSDNNADAIRRQRNAALRGEKSPSAKLTDDKVQWAREQYASKAMTKTDIARALGVAMTTISAVIERKSWKHVK